MRLGLLTTSFPRAPGDYAGSFVGDRVALLLAQGHQVDVLAAGEPPPGGEASTQGRSTVTRSTGTRSSVTRLTVTRLPSAIPGGPSLFYGAGAPEMLEQRGAAAALAAARFSIELTAAAAARARGWDAIEAHWLVPSALAALAAAPGLARRAYAHSGDVALLERIPLGRALARALVRGGTDLRFVSDHLRNRFAGLVGRPVGTVESLPAPGDLFVPRGRGPDAGLRRSLGLAAPTLLAVGRLVPIKGHDALLRSCARARAAGSAVEVVILGDGPERTRLEHLGRALGVPLRLLGFVPRGDVARWLAAADVYVQPSIALANGRAEGAPLAAAEARAVGIPVIIESDPRRLTDAIRSVTGV